MELVRIAAAAREAILAHARDTKPGECCGLLVGKPGSIERAVRARNLAGQPTRYLMDPADHIRVRRAARACSSVWASAGKSTLRRSSSGKRTISDVTDSSGVRTRR